MRTQGSLIKWNADRGFGFIRTRDSGIEVFVHISEFPRSGRTPQVGETLHFEIATARDGRQQAKAVAFDTPPGGADLTLARIERMPPPRMPSASAPAPRDPSGHRRNARREPRRESAGLMSRIVVGALLLGGAVFGYEKFAARQTATVDMTQAPIVENTIAPATAPAATREYVCDGREHCTQMGSCAEAKWFIRHCPNTKMDGDGDGIPCEQQLCG